MTTALFRFRHHRRRATLVIGLVFALLLTGAGIATARWITVATTTTPVAAGTLTTELTGTAALTRSNISTTQYGKPVPLTLRNPSPVPVNYTLTFAPAAGTLPPAAVGLAVWQPAGTTCPDTTPTTGVTTGTLAAPPTLQVPGSTGPTTVVCAAARFTGTLFGSAGQTRTIIPKLEAKMTTGTWTATADGPPFTLTMASPTPVTTVGCTNWDERRLVIFVVPRGVTLRWAPVPGATGYELTTLSGQPLEGMTNPLPASQTSVSVSSNYADARLIYVTALGPTGKSTPAQQTVRFETSFWGNALRCVN